MKSDMLGLPSSVIPSYGEFALLPHLLAQRGLAAEGVAAVLGGNYSGCCGRRCSPRAGLPHHGQARFEIDARDEGTGD